MTIGKLKSAFCNVLAASFLLSCHKKPIQKSSPEIFEEILNNPAVNTKEVGEQEGIHYFQFMKNGKTGFRDLDGNIVIPPVYESAEMFSEGFSAVQKGNKWGLIDETGKFVIEPRFEFLGSVHGGLASFRSNDKYGFVDSSGKEIIKPMFDWADDFSEGLCAVRNDPGKPGSGKNGYIDTSGRLVIDFQFKFAGKFENGVAKVLTDHGIEYIDNKGNKIPDTPGSK